MAHTFSVSSGKIDKGRKKKALLCPKCGRGRLIDENTRTKSEVRVVEDDTWPADYYAKCLVCKAQIGVRKIE